MVLQATGSHLIVALVAIMCSLLASAPDSSVQSVEVTLPGTAQQSLEHLK